MAQHIGLLTSGGDTPGLNAALRGVGKAAIRKYDMQLVGIRDGFKGLMENRFMILDQRALSGILTLGGTILGTSRNKPHKMSVGGKILDMTDVIIENYHKKHLDALVCLGGGGTLKNAQHLMKHGVNVMHLPKTIDNDVEGTDTTFGFDTALGIATDAIDRLHSTAHSHHRIIVVEIMGHKAGWLALGAGVAGGADVILIPEIPYDIDFVAESIMRRARNGSPFSIVAVAEGALSIENHSKISKLRIAMDKADKKEEKQGFKAQIKAIEFENKQNTIRIAHQLEAKTRLEARVTILGHLQRGGTPSAADRLLATRLGTACAEYLNSGIYNVMVAADGDSTKAVPIDEVAGIVKMVPLDHQWIATARDVGTCMGDY